jgi:LacI family transcriptional regulator
MRDVAQLAGVSQATVSAVINSTAPVSALRVKKVRDAMEALDYHPDQVARSLKVGRTDVIGMVLPDITNAFFPEVVRGVEAAAEQQGYSVMLCDSNEDPARERRHLSAFFSRRVDGVLIACTDESAAYESLVRRRFPIVFVDRVPNGLSVSAVSTDNVDAAFRATRHLIELGHQGIALITGNLRLSPHARRLEGFRLAMQSANLPVRDEYLRIGDLQIEAGHQFTRELLSLPEPPTAIISSNNRMLLGVMRAIFEVGLRCPEQISVLGFDDYVWTANFSPRLTTVAQPASEIGRRAMEMLLGKMRMEGDDNVGNRVELVKADLRIRESTGPCVRSSIVSASSLSRSAR